MSLNRNLITAERHATTSTDASGVFDLQSQAVLKASGSWPGVITTVYEIQYTITNSGTTFELRDYGTVNYVVDWGDGSATETVTTNNKSHTYASASTYIVKLDTTGSYRPYYNNNANGDQVTAATIDATAIISSLGGAFRGHNNMTSFVCPFAVTSTISDFASAFRELSSLTSFPLIDTSNGTNFTYTWQENSSLTSFPLLDFSSATNLSSAWQSCTGLTSFPLINTSSCTRLSNTWNTCSSLTSFPVINTANCTIFQQAWENCSSLTSFPSLDFSSATTVRRAWLSNTSLTTFPANRFNSTGTLASNAFEITWQNCALTAQSIENILTSLDTNGSSSITLGINGGTNAAYSTWSTAAQTALTNLTTKGWTVTYNT